MSILPATTFDTAELADAAGYTGPAENELGSNRLAHQRAYRIQTTDVLSATQFRTPEERDLILWLHHHCLRHDISLAEIAARLVRQGSDKSYNWNTLHKALVTRGYKSVKNMCDAIKAYRLVQENLDRADAPLIVRSPLLSMVWQMCNVTRKFRRLTFIYGVEQSGKTKGLTTYTQYNRVGQTYMVRMPNKGKGADLVRILAREFNVPTSGSIAMMVVGIAKSLMSDDLLIVDEFHNCIRWDNPKATAETIGYIREIWDIAQCGLIMAGSPALQELLHDDGFRYRDQVREFFKRRISECNLPDVPQKADLNSIAKAMGLPNASGEALQFQTAVIAKDGQGVWFNLLAAGRQLAADLDERFTWDHVLRADAFLKDLAEGRILVSLDAESMPIPAFGE